MLSAETLARLPHLDIVGIVGLSLAHHSPDGLLTRNILLVNASHAYADSVAEFALGLAILGRRRAFASHEVMRTELERFGSLERGGQHLHRFRVGDYRVYFQRHELGVVVHRILSKNTLKDFLFRSSLPVGGEDEALEKNPKFWELIESAAKQ